MTVQLIDHMGDDEQNAYLPDTGGYFRRVQGAVNASQNGNR